MSITVRGGSNGIEAHYDDMTRLARLFGAAATSTAEHAAHLHGYLINPDVVSAAALDPYGAARFSGALLDALDGPDGLFRLAAQCGAKDLELRAAAATYVEADRLQARYLPAVQGMLDTVTIMPATAAGTLKGHPGDAINQWLVGQSDLVVGLASRFWHNWAALNALASYPDGRPVITPRGDDASAIATAAPTNLKGVLSGLAHRCATSGGDIDVRFVYSEGAGGHPVRHVIVDIPGIDTVNPSPYDPDPTSFGTNLHALAGLPSTYGNGVVAAMRQAGVTATDPVLLVGHSQGGMVAMNIAKEMTGPGKFNITHVITAGSPVAHIAVPRSVQVLSIENDSDFVPHLDGASNPDQTNLTTVTIHRDHAWILDNHDVDRSYVPGAGDIDASDDPSVRSYLAGLSGFLGGTRTRTEVFHVKRTTKPGDPWR